MAEITLKSNKVHTLGYLPSVGSQAPDFSMTLPDLSDQMLYQVKAKLIVLNIFPSIDTGTCALSVRQFNQRAASLANTKIICLSKDLPFAQKRFCGAEGIENVMVASVFRSDFAKQYQLQMIDGPLKGLCSRAVILLDESYNVLYVEQVAEITSEPNYDDVMKLVS